MNLEMYHYLKDVSYHDSTIKISTMKRLWSQVIYTFFFFSSHYKREETLKELEDLCI